jgi:hypothetical protein
MAALAAMAARDGYLGGAHAARAARGEVESHAAARLVASQRLAWPPAVESDAALYNYFIRDSPYAYKIYEAASETLNDSTTHS